MSVDVEAIEDDAIREFLSDLEYHGKSERTRRAYARVLCQFEEFLTDATQTPTGSATTPAAAGRRECMAWVHSLRGDLESSTVATYASYLHRFYAYMVEVGEFERNPMGVVRDEMDEEIDTDPARRDISVPAMRRFVADIGHPLTRAVVVTMLKTGVRVGEICNLDLRDLSLSADAGQYRLGTRVQLSNRPDTLYVDSDVQRGDVVNGEERSASNKRKRATVIPVDDELSLVLRQWLLVRPDGVSAAQPLFVSTGDQWGHRLTPSMVRSMLEPYTRKAGWYRDGAGASENVTPHYFRHFFTTHLRDRTGDRGIVKYLRGDVAADIIDTYTHDWGTRVRDTYEANIYSVL